MLAHSVRTVAVTKQVKVRVPLLPTWLDQALDKMNAMSALQLGWNGYSAQPPNDSSIVSAKKFVKKLALLGIRPRSVMPTAVGGVAILVNANGRTVVAEFYNAGGACAAHTSSSTSPRVYSFSDEANWLEIHRAKNFLYGKIAD
jgi:hypothetical protein